MMSWFAVAALAADLPSLDEPHRSGASAPADAAVVIGIEDYAFLTDVPYAARDAAAMADLLTYTMGVPASRVHVLDALASRETVLDAVDAAAREAGKGTLWIYFAGHGTASPRSAERLWLGVDAQPLESSVEARGIPVSLVQERAAAHGARVALLADTCYAGVDRKGTSLLPGKRVAVPAYAVAPVATVLEWNAAGPNDLSGPLEPTRHGAFTYFMVGALRGWADGEVDGSRDGQVTAVEASAYVQRALRAAGVREQTPHLAALGAEGWSLSRGTERGPDFGGTGPVTTGGPSELPVLGVEPPQPPDTTGEVVDLIAALEEKANALSDQARRDWETTRAYAEGHAGTEEALVALRRYAAHRQVEVEVEGSRKFVNIPERDEALAMMARLPRTPRPAGPTPAIDVAEVPAGDLVFDRSFKVTLTRPLLMMTTEVSQGQFLAVMGYDPTASRVWFTGDDLLSAVPCDKAGRGPDLPVVCVDYYDALAFANALSVAQGLTPAYTYVDGTVRLERSASGWRLPTNAEWSFAAREGARNPPKEVQGDPALCAVGNLGDQAYARAEGSQYPGVPCDDGHAGLAPVGSFAANALGLHDLIGNAKEWVWEGVTPDSEPKLVDPASDFVQAGGTTLDGYFWLDWMMGTSYRQSERGVEARMPMGRLENDPEVGFRLVRAAP